MPCGTGSSRLGSVVSPEGVGRDNANVKSAKRDVLLAGVGGQGIVSIAAALATAALAEGWYLKQAEVHGMSQRGGAVQSHLRISGDVIYSDLISLGSADLLLSVEPLEALRYLPYLSEGGMLVTAREPYRNIAAYPETAALERALSDIPGRIVVDAESLAREAGHPRTANMAVLGAAALFTGIAAESLAAAISTLFGAKGPKVIEANLRAFHLGREATEQLG